MGFNIFLTLMSQSEFQLFGKNFICGGLSLKTIFYKKEVGAVKRAGLDVI